MTTPDKPQRKRRLGMRLTDEEYDLIRAAANKKRIPVGIVIRLWVLEAATQEVKS